MTKFKRVALLAILLGFSFQVMAQDVDIPYTRYVLDNGFTLIVHEDHKAPIIAANIWYHVGSKNEHPGITGFAHLFEHLMFTGSEHFNDEWLNALAKVGATTVNGTTWYDRTNYFQNVPSNALDMILWMESDRMGHLLGVIDQEKLDEQREVVKNEKRQGENQPYGKDFEIIGKAVFPADHPYNWETIGSMEDLDAASPKDVKNWFRTYYGAANAVLVLAGDITPEVGLEKVKHYFGDIPSGPPLASVDTWIPNHKGERRHVRQDRVPQARLYKTWAVPGHGASDTDYLDLAADVLANGKNSRLYKRLVYTDQIATSVSASVFNFEVTGLFMLQIDAQPGQDLAEVERAVNEEIERFLKRGISKVELERVKTQKRAAFIRGLEAVGGFGGKSSVLAASEVYGGSPDAYKDTLDHWNAATPGIVIKAARNWLNDGAFVLETHPFPEYAAAESGAERVENGFPEVGEFPQVGFPARQQATLSNGLEVVLVERHALPIVEMTLAVNMGYAADKFATPGSASLMLAMLDEGTAKRGSLEISDELDRLGAEMGASANLDHSRVSLSALKENLEASLNVFADVILNASFPQQEFDRLQKQRLAAIEQEKVSPLAMALRVFPQLVYGKDHLYGMSYTGSGTTESVSSLTRDEVQALHAGWFRPNNATLVVVGDTTLDELMPLLEKQFARWKPGDVAIKNAVEVTVSDKPALYFINRSGSEQSTIFAGHVMPPKSADNDLAVEAMNTVLGASFVARINMNLREDKGWSYGAQSYVLDTSAQRPFLIYAPVQTDRTADSISEIYREISEFVDQRPATQAEVDRAKSQRTLTLPGRWETGGAVAADLVRLYRFGLNQDYWDTYADRVRDLNRDQVNAAAKETLYPDNLVWIVVGDLEKVEEDVKRIAVDLGVTVFHHMDADGNLLD